MKNLAHKPWQCYRNFVLLNHLLNMRYARMTVEFRLENLSLSFHPLHDPVVLLYIVLSSLCWLNPSFAFSILKFEAPDDQRALHGVTVNPNNGDVFVTGHNVLYQLTRNLQLKHSYRFEPVAEDLAYLQAKSDCSPRDGQGTVVLEIDASGELLLHCGAVATPGECSVFLAENLNHVDQLVVIKSNRRNQINKPTRGLVGVFGRSGPSHEYVLHVASSYDGNCSNASAEIVRGDWDRSAMSFASFNQKVGFGTDDINEALHHHHHQKTFNVEYLYGFEHNGFAYFLTVQQDSLLEPYSYETRLARVCKGDRRLISYTEVALSCGCKDGTGIFYNIAVAADLAPMGEEFAHKFRIAPNSSALYVVFGKSFENSRDIDEKVGYGLCVYSIDDIESFFAKVQRECYEGLGRRLQWINQDDPPCSMNISQATGIGNNFCGDKRNVGIGSRYPLATKLNITIYDHIPTALLVTTYQEKTIAILGTAGGHLLKYLVDGMNSAPYGILSIAASQAVAGDMALHVDKKHVYVLTGSKVSTIPVQSCSVYMTCATCVTTLDPLDCGWCEDHCTTKETCHSGFSWSKTTCPPVLETFHPRSGPVNGGTRLTILGQNFGVGTRLPDGLSTATVVVAGSMCSVEFHNATCIICQTTSALMMKAQEKGVKVTVNDLRKSTSAFQISGSSSSGSLTFSYQIPSLSSFLPTFGPVSGGTQLTIVGTDLDIGSTHEVLVAQQKCLIERISATEIVCLTSALNLNSEHHPEHRLPPGVGTLGPVNVSIDGAMLGISDTVFSYKDDPLITGLFPPRSIISGGMSVTVIGTNLNTIQQPQIVAHFRDELSFVENCSSHSDGKSMICLSPDVTNAVSKPSIDKSLHFQLEFFMDGAKNVLDANLSDFVYGVNPDVISFPGADRTCFFNMDENYLEITGRNLDLVATSSDYQVLIGNEKCHITQLTSFLLLCQPDKSDVLHARNSLKEVKVFIGRLVFSVGFLQWSERHKESFIMLTTAPIMGSAAIVIIILFFYLVHKLWRKKRHLDFIASYPHHAINQFEVNVLPNDIGPEDMQNPYLFQGNNNSPQDSEGAVDDWHIIHNLDILISRERITMKNVIGQGRFGCVHRGILQSTDGKSETKVAVKMLRNNGESLAARKFYEEALLMKDFDHVHILRLIGIAQDDDGLPLVVLPFMQNGDLLTYIRCGDNAPTVRELMEFGIQVAAGMAYLSNCKYVHRDLSARNCMLDENMQIKVADFGLSRDVYERDYYSCDNRHSKLPVKWMALESLEKGIYSSKSDVWSYGIVLWELMTRGVTPYPEVDNWDVVRFLKSGRRLPQPAFAPNDLYSLMLICWHPVPGIRPTFGRLAADIQGIIRSLECVYRAVEINLSSSYVNANTDETYLDPRSSKPTGSKDSKQESDLSQFSGFLDTAV